MQRSATWVTVLVMIGSVSAQADEVRFGNGDRLTGTIQRMTGGRLSMDTQVAGAVTVDLAQVETLATDAPVEIHFRDGTVVRQQIRAAAAGRFAIAQGDMPEPRTFALADVLAINPPPPAPPARPVWNGSLSAGLSTSRGDADTDNLTLSVGLARSSSNDRVRVNASYLYGRQRDPRSGARITTQDSWYATGKYDYFLANRYFVYANSRVEQDQIADLDLRLIAGFGGGYRWVDTPDHRLSTEGGFSWLHETFAGSANNSEISVQLAYDLERKLGDRLRLLHDTTYYPSVSDLSDFFLSTQAELRSSLSPAMYANLRVVLNYDSTPAPGRGNSNFKYMVGAGMNF